MRQRERECLLLAGSKRDPLELLQLIYRNSDGGMNIMHIDLGQLHNLSLCRAFCTINRISTLPSFLSVPEPSSRLLYSKWVYESPMTRNGKRTGCSKYMYVRG